MKKQRSQTLQQRFGFADDDLKTSKHDEILLWLDDHALNIAKSLLNWNGTWSSELVRSKTARFENALSGRIEELTKRTQQPSPATAEDVACSSQRIPKSLTVSDMHRDDPLARGYQTYQTPAHVERHGR